MWAARRAGDRAGAVGRESGGRDLRRRRWSSSGTPGRPSAFGGGGCRDGQFRGAQSGVESRRIDGRRACLPRASVRSDRRVALSSATRRRAGRARGGERWRVKRSSRGGGVSSPSTATRRRPRRASRRRGSRARQKLTPRLASVAGVASRRQGSCAEHGAEHGGAWPSTFTRTGALPAARAVFAPTSRGELKTAVDACIAESPAGICVSLAAAAVPSGQGTGTYGAIGTWDVSAVTSMHQCTSAPSHSPPSVRARPQPAPC